MRVEIVRSAEEAAEKTDPDARVLVIADGLVTTDPVMDRMAAEGAEAFARHRRCRIARGDRAARHADCWAGIARISPSQLAQIAQMPEDYDFQSALLRVAAQSGAEHVPLAGLAAQRAMRRA
jgi:hypothetical protein